MQIKTAPPKIPVQLDRGAERLHRLSTELIRRYQFRDWNRICCYGVSVSQSYVLDLLAAEGDLSMQELAQRMFRSVSTMTRVVAQLVKRGHVQRRNDPRDRRVVQVRLTPQGKAVVAAITRDLIESQKAILQTIPAQDWPGAFAVLEALAKGARRWQEECCAV